MKRTSALVAANEGVSGTTVRKWIGPFLAAVAMVVSIGIPVVSIVESHERKPDAERLWVADPTPAIAQLDGIAASISERGEGLMAARQVATSSSRVIDGLMERSRGAETVMYTIVSGGSLRNVANNFGIFHHEITDWNPGVGLDTDLPAGSKVVVFQHKAGARSESIGRASAGTLRDGVPMLEGPGRVLRANRFKLWGTASTVNRMDWVLTQWAKRYPERQLILVGNLSLRSGGKVTPHKSHQSGRDIDISYPQVWDGVEEIHWEKMNTHNLDREQTWDLIDLLVGTNAISVIYVDYELQRLLYEYAKETNRYDDVRLKGLLQFPDDASVEGRIISHAPGHVDHLHVRFLCDSRDTQCVDG